MRIHHHLKLSIALQVLTLIALVLCHLALTDIYHGERDATLEWRILQVSAIVFLVTVVESTYTLCEVASKGRDL